MSKISLKLCKFSPWNSLNLDLRKMSEPFNSLLAKFRESQLTWVQKDQGKSGNFAKKTGWKPCDYVGSNFLWSIAILQIVCPMIWNYSVGWYIL